MSVTTDRATLMSALALAAKGAVDTTLDWLMMHEDCDAHIHQFLCARRRELERAENERLRRTGT